MLWLRTPYLIDYCLLQQSRKWNWMISCLFQISSKLESSFLIMVAVLNTYLVHCYHIVVYWSDFFLFQWLWSLDELVYYCGCYKFAFVNYYSLQKTDSVASPSKIPTYTQPIYTIHFSQQSGCPQIEYPSIWPCSPLWYALIRYMWICCYWKNVILTSVQEIVEIMCKMPCSLHSVWSSSS
jgi:hypothetical protein